MADEFKIATETWVATEATIKLNGENIPKASYGANGVQLAVDGSTALGIDDYIVNANGLSIQRVYQLTAATTLTLADAGKLVEIDKARTARVDHVWITGATAGTYTITVNGNTTATIDWNADNEAVEDELEALLNIGPTNVTVTGAGTSSGNPFVITYAAALGDVGAISLNLGGLTGVTASSATTATAAVTTVQVTIPGSGATPPDVQFPQGFRLDFVQSGDSQIVFAIASGETGQIFAAAEAKTAGRWSGATLYKRTVPGGSDPNEWVLVGDLAAA